jgi:hypothetical protein
VPPRVRLVLLLSRCPVFRGGGARGSPAGPRAGLRTVTHVFKLSSARECHGGRATPNCSAAQSVKARRYALRSRGLPRVAHCQEEAAIACRRIAATARASVRGLAERGDQFNPLFCAKPGLGLGFRQLERVLCLNHEVSSTAVELAVNLGMASISEKKASLSTRTMHWIHTI